MPLSKKAFEILSFVERKNGEKLSQRRIAAGARLSLGAVNKAIPQLVEEGLLEITDSRSTYVTRAGLEALAPYRVKRAIILAAGFGSRMMPITLNTPKGLVKVRGKPIIETMLDAIVRAGIEEIYIVRGYLADHYDILLKKYPNIIFVENPDYKESNTVSSAMKVLPLIRQAYVIDSDIYLMNPDIIRKYEYCANYTGIYVEKTDDWCMVMKGDRIVGYTLGGTNCYHMCNITYWTEEDGDKLMTRVPEMYAAPGGKERYWDEAPLLLYTDDFHVELRPCEEGDFIELDSLSELQEFDPVYRMN
ncbi:MAG: NTP transferase domain-containing protein [Oscillospiraceae bacterium]|jgi:CTP:phosphocholine cytidylyltransferase-like protein/predicted transcriptional regulator|nr:NTP transferase domain-containing protein [Oscillospiraceae bacterium]